MYAFEIPSTRFSLPAGGAIARHRFVAAGDGVATQAGATDNVIGVSMNEVTNTAALPYSKQIAEIADGIVIVETGAAIAAGALVSSNADGKAITTASSAPVAGVALFAATAAGQLISVKLK